MTIEQYRNILKKYWGYDDFRGIQREIIESIGSGHDTLGLMPTGGGKSITFQVPALAMSGVCIVITPLIALMMDQVQNLRKRYIQADAIHSGLAHDDILRILENAVYGGVKILYVSPERLSSELFIKKVEHMAVSFICVDEAHCISQWGYDFRPSYLAIDSLRKVVPEVPVLALTATATPLVVDDIQERLAFRERRVFRMSFERKNLAYVVRTVSDKEEQLVHILNNIAGTAIVYTRSRRRTKELADMLQGKGIHATWFHAGLDTAEKEQRQQDWQNDRVRVMVATNAFGMGIDKPDVRVVVHADCPDSIEAYFQEAGRAGRDGKKAYAVLLYNDSDTRKLVKRISDSFPEKEEIRTIYDHLAYFFQVALGSGYNAVYEFPIDRFCSVFHHFPTRVLSALKILNRAGYLEYNDEEENRARVMFRLERDDLYRLHYNGAQQDAVIVALLRNYTGLFNEYSYIDEGLIAQQTGLTLPEVYLALKDLDRKGIVSFIPQRSTPLVRYLQSREESNRLVFPPAIYDELKHRFEVRIKKMIQYATSEDCCRSRLLLSYFGEERAADCKQCDVCQQHYMAAAQGTEDDKAAAEIMSLLSDGKPHHVSALQQLKLPYASIDAALMQLVENGTVTDDDGMLSKA